MYKLKEGYVYRQVAGAHMVIPIGGNVANFNGIISLNETGAFLWQRLEESTDPRVLAGFLAEEFEVSEERAGEDVKAFLEHLLANQVLEEV